MNYLIFIAGLMIYLAIGSFISFFEAKMNDKDVDASIIWFWPVYLALIIFIFPAWLAAELGSYLGKKFK